MVLNLTERDGLKRQGHLTRRLRWLSPSLVALAVIALFGVAAPAAKADTYDFTMTDASNLFTITFSLPSSPVPDSYISGFNFTLDSVAYNINGYAETPTVMDFYNGEAGGGLDIGANVSPMAYYVINQGTTGVGDQLYTGAPDESAPTFVTGTYDLTDLGGAVIGNGDDFTLTITDATPAVPTPEPSSLLLLGVGLLAMSGLIVYQQKRWGTVLAAAESQPNVAS